MKLFGVITRVVWAVALLGVAVGVDAQGSSAAMLAKALGFDTSPAYAQTTYDDLEAEGIGNTQAFTPLNVDLSNGRAYFEVGACNSGRCGARDVDPGSVGPLRPWQSYLNMTGRGVQTYVVDANGNNISYIGNGTTVCFNVPFTNELSTGGINKYFVAYWDATIANCDNDWNTEGPNKSSLCKKDAKGNWYPLPNTSRNLLSNRTYDVCGSLLIPATFALFIAK